MYLSRLSLNPSSRIVRRDLANCHQLHSRVLSAFSTTPSGDESARAKFSVLHRIDVNPHTGRIILLVQSVEPPDWSSLPPDYLAAWDGADPSEVNPAVKNVQDLYALIQNDLLLTFRLRANPTKKKSQKSDRLAGGPNKNGKRIPLIRDETLIAWLARKGQDGGFALETVRVSKDVPDARASPEGNITGKKPSKGAAGSTATLTFRSILFEGHLRVTDRDRFLATLQSGIGSGKAYGFGLLSVAPAR